MSLQKLEIEQEGVGKLPLQEEIPPFYQHYLLSGATAFFLEGDGIVAIFQVFAGKGFRVWYSRYWATKKVVLKARGEISALELRISWKNQIKGSWEKILLAEVPEFHYQFGFVPHTFTRAEFQANTEYETCDAHFDLDFFNDFGMDYKMFLQFIELVAKDEPAELYPAPKACPGEMINAAHAILRNTYSAAGKVRLLETCVTNILLAALEDSDPDGFIVKGITPEEYAALHEAKKLIEEHFPKYPGNRFLARKVGLSLTYFVLGFKQVFGENPHKFYLLMRIDRGKELLRRGYTVKAVAMELEYETDQSFSRIFTEYVKIPPKDYQLRFKK